MSLLSNCHSDSSMTSMKVTLQFSDGYQILYEFVSHNRVIIGQSAVRWAYTSPPPNPMVLSVFFSSPVLEVTLR